VEKPLGSAYTSYVKGVSRKFKHTGNQYDIGTIFKTKNTLRTTLMKIRPKKRSATDGTGVYIAVVILTRVVQ
jgi:hypothetical protein